MSRSIHHTLKSVFGGKSKSEIKRMVENQDPDFLAYLEKFRIKQHVRNMRQLKELAEHVGEDLPSVLDDTRE